MKKIAALVHDLAECIVGDITPHCGVSPEEKHRREDEAMKLITELTGLAGDTMYELYKVNVYLVLVFLRYTYLIGNEIIFFLDLNHAYLSFQTNQHYESTIGMKC